jgi:3-hydroxyisobutyrate dehydrogenase-like beta-hydroxyacid dehydrogenase
MGLPIARNLLERGFTVTGFRRSGSPELVAAGGTFAGSPADVAASADVLLSVLPAAGAVEDVVRGPHGTLHGLRPGTVHIEASPGLAVARMWLLSAACQAWLSAAASGPVRALTDDEIEAWQAVEGDLLPRLWLYLRRKATAD